MNRRLPRQWLVQVSRARVRCGSCRSGFIGVALPILIIGAMVVYGPKATKEMIVSI